MALRQKLRTSTVEDVLAIGMHQFIDQIQCDLNDIAAALHQDYFHALTTA